jgi:hypothetical protein
MMIASTFFDPSATLLTSASFFRSSDDRPRRAKKRGCSQNNCFSLTLLELEFRNNGFQSRPCYPLQRSPANARGRLGRKKKTTSSAHVTHTPLGTALP